MKMSCVRPQRLSIDYRCFVTFNFHSHFFKCSYLDKTMFDTIEIFQVIIKHFQFIKFKFYINRKSHSGEMLYESLVQLEHPLSVLPKNRNCCNDLTIACEGLTINLGVYWRHRLPFYYAILWSQIFSENKNQCKC